MNAATSTTTPATSFAARCACRVCHCPAIVSRLHSAPLCSACGREGRHFVGLLRTKPKEEDDADD